MSEVRDKTLEDFKEVLEWVQSNNLDATVIGGLAVGAFAAERGIPSFSADLDLLVSPAQQKRFAQLAAAEPRAKIVKRPEPRGLAVLIVEWSTLEIDVLTKSHGLSSPTEARKRAWPVGGFQIADPVDLLSIKLAMMRKKDLPHIDILRAVCDGFANYFFESKPGRAAFEFLRRWCAVEGWERLPQELSASLVERASRTSAQGRRFLVGHAHSKAGAFRVIVSAPQEERATLRAILEQQKT